VTAPPAAKQNGSLIWALLVGAAGLAGAVAATIGALSLTDALLATGLPNPGLVTSYGLPFVRAVAEVAGVTAVGAFVLAAFFVPPQSSGVLDVDGYRSLRLGLAASAVCAVCSAAMVPLTISDVSGEPVSEYLAPVRLWQLAGQIDTVNAWRWMAIIACLVAVFGRVVLRWAWTPLLAADRTIWPPTVC
jgi:hypothetical protein